MAFKKKLVFIQHRYDAVALMRLRQLGWVMCVLNPY